MLEYSLTHVDEVIELLTKDYSCDIALPRIKKSPYISLKSFDHLIIKLCFQVIQAQFLKCKRRILPSSSEESIIDAHTEIACLMLGKEGKPVADYVLKMKGYVEKLERLGYVLPQDITVGLILNGLTKDFVGFVRNYNMHNMGKTIGEFMLYAYEYEEGFTKRLKTPQEMMKGERKDKKVYIPKPKNTKPTAMESPTKDDACHHCKEVGHWKRNCPVYLAELLKKKKQVGSASSSGIFTIELFSFPNNNSWVYDTGCGTRICITKQGFRIERKLKQGALYLYVGNGVRAQVEAIGSFDLVLPNGLMICLDNCHYAPTITRGVVLVSRLVDNRFVQCFTDYGISVSKNDVLYFNAIARNESATRILNMVPTKKVDKTPYELWYGKVPNLSYLKERWVTIYTLPLTTNVVARYAEFFEKRLISQEINERAVYLEEIQEEEDTTPSEITSSIPQEVEGFEPPQEEVILIHRSERTHRAPNRLCLNVKVEEHSLEDPGEPTNYKAAMLDPKSKRWVDAMNAVGLARSSS
ncbi:retrotransposon protein, putative, ty1-copia subclass [Tanacetum coccineum]